MKVIISIAYFLLYGFMPKLFAQDIPDFMTLQKICVNMVIEIALEIVTLPAEDIKRAPRRTTRYGKINS